MIQYVLFDLAEVCVTGLIGIERCISQNTGKSKKEICEHLRGKKLIEIFQGKISEGEYWNRVIKEGEYQESVGFFKGIVREYFKKEIPGTINIIKKLNNKGYPIGLISDHVKEWIEFLESEFDLFNLFDYKTYSFDTGYTKFEGTENFVIAMDNLNADPSRTLFIDDRIENLVLAEKAGIGYVHLFTDADNLEEYLLKQNVRID